MTFLNQSEWVQRCSHDGEFKLASRHWEGGLILHMGEATRALHVQDDVVKEGPHPTTLNLEYTAAHDVWKKILANEPERFHNDLTAKRATDQELRFKGDHLMQAQYYGAVMRAIELLRREPVAYLNPLDSSAETVNGQIDAPMGRYIHLEIAGTNYRIYYEEAGTGIPLLLHHTAGCHSSQWRHLFELPEITSRFRLIAYDLPFHGKSLPPTSKEWWAEPYVLRGKLLRSLPLKLIEALHLHNPVFMGCSVGGLLALDLAHKHANQFCAVISVEGALNISGDVSDPNFGYLWHPQVSNEYKGRLMDGLMAPQSPITMRRETSFVYTCGWPPSFLGDLYYYGAEYNLTDCAHEIDTNEVGVHILSGEYDYSGSVELGKQAHDAIPGSTWAEMKGVGHFPMSENPQVFASYLLPILDRIDASVGS